MADTAQSSPTQLLRGHIRNLRSTRQSQEFLFTEADRTAMGATAVAAGLAGLGGVAIGLAASADDTAEKADLLEFELDGKSIRAWVWVSVFKNGDEVEVVAEPFGEIWHAFGIKRVSDRIVALHPHCSRGRYAHYKATARWWIGLTGIFLLCFNIFAAVVLYFSGESDWFGVLNLFLGGGVIVAMITGVISFRIGRRMMKFVRLAEGIFLGFGWKDVKSIDLPAITKNSKKPGEPGALGVLYFRY
ncbi:putative type VI secretion system effector [Burkholderia aenigmatica]|uniref:putative type VI secretion system effector n=1 Tax=Burkholderia aenigmatica TaxID=2015348 RepID=UPI00265313CA|nr:putative type VI secretion system effector [Burkholderia aenigmatica]MDN7874516.1 putative type VI secretion system effector [Burkholderia aenigmatica]